MLANLISYVVESYGPIKGKKAFQKIFYFLTEMGVDTKLNYSLYHYGPYSSKLDADSKMFEDIGAIAIDKEGYKFSIHDSILTKEYARVVKDDPELTDKVDSIIAKLPIENGLKLELYSTTHYAAKVIREIYCNDDINDVIEEVISIKKDKFKRNEIEKAYYYLKENEFIN